jgi:hypothetical protein
MGYTPPTIDVGDAASNRVTRAGYGYTRVSKGNPANAAGKITSVAMWANENLSNCEVATFFVVSGNNLSTRDTTTIGSVTAGSKKVFSVDLNVEVGDYIGCHFTAGKIEYDTTGGAGMWSKSGDNIPCTNALFSAYGGHLMSLYGSSSGNLTEAEAWSIVDSWGAKIWLAEAFSIADSLVKSATKQLAEAWSVVDSWVARVNLSEAFSITDSLVKSATKQLAEAFSIADSKVTKISKALAETYSITDSLVKNVTKQLAEAWSVVDTCTHRLRLSESFQIVDSFVKTVSFYFAEAFGVVDSYRTSTIWIEEIKKAVGWTEETKKTTMYTKEAKKTANWTKE